MACNAKYISFGDEEEMPSIASILRSSWLPLDILKLFDA
jgi:hypothetical protein